MIHRWNWSEFARLGYPILEVFRELRGERRVGWRHDPSFRPIFFNELEPRAIFSVAASMRSRILLTISRKTTSGITSSNFPPAACPKIVLELSPLIGRSS